MKIEDISYSDAYLPLQDSRIYYKGHGQTESSSEQNSALHVIAHEMQHVAEFKAEALRDKVEIRNIDIDINFEMRNGKLVAVGGKAKMTAEKEEDHHSHQDDSFFHPDLSEVKSEFFSKTGFITYEEKEIAGRLNTIQDNVQDLLTHPFYRDSEKRSIDDYREEKHLIRREEHITRIDDELRQMKKEKKVQKNDPLMFWINSIQGTISTGTERIGHLPKMINISMRG